LTATARDADFVRRTMTWSARISAAVPTIRWCRCRTAPPYGEARDYAPDLPNVRRQEAFTEAAARQWLSTCMS
jgi:hypothetical protein